jgi:hypothetical protein
MKTQNQQDSYLRARERVKAIKDFYSEVLSYCIVIPFLAWLNWKTTGFGVPWVIFPAIAWGFGLAIQGMEAYGLNPLWGKRWEERKIRELMASDSPQPDRYTNR